MASRGRLVLGSIFAGSLLALMWFSPVSPTAVARADALAQSGETDRALVLYQRVAKYHPMASQRVRARMRSALWYEVELGSAPQAVSLLRQVAEDPSATSGERGRAFAEMGRLFLRSLDDPKQAAAAYQMAYAADPEDPEAGERLMASARTRQTSGALEEAHQAWETVGRRFPLHLAESMIAQGEILLAKGKVAQALERFEGALAVTTDEKMMQLARLGAATCKERLGSIEAAIAELEAADLPENLESVRKDAMESRSEGSR